MDNLKYPSLQAMLRVQAGELVRIAQEMIEAANNLDGISTGKN